MTADQIKSRLQQAYPDAEIEVIDLTGTLDHWQVHIRSGAFGGQPRIRQHKAVMDVFSAELKSGEIHAFSIKTETK